tara:strand:+ start:223 stop:483 length:261 start_codon:yes stop_codon:yes gene_type:complete
MTDYVNSPPHYNAGNIECIDAIQQSMQPDAFFGYLKGNIQKYVWRYEMKKGVQDLEKAQWYLNKLIKVLKEEEMVSEQRTEPSDTF